MNDHLILTTLAGTLDCSIKDIALNATLDELGMSSLQTTSFSFDLEDAIGLRLDMTKFPITGTVRELLLFIESEALNSQNPKNSK